MGLESLGQGDRRARALNFATENGNKRARVAVHYPHALFGEIVGSQLTAVRCGDSHVNDIVPREHQLLVRIKSSDIRR